METFGMEPQRAVALISSGPQSLRRQRKKNCDHHKTKAKTKARNRKFATLPASTVT